MYENRADDYAVVENLMKIGRATQNHGAKKIHTSSIILRKGYRYGGILRKVNELLYMVCVAEDFLFIDQANITMAHISSDGIHLNSHGSAILLYISSLFDAFDRNFIDSMMIMSMLYPLLDLKVKLMGDQIFLTPSRSLRIVLNIVAFLRQGAIMTK